MGRPALWAMLAVASGLMLATTWYTGQALTAVSAGIGGVAHAGTVPLNTSACPGLVAARSTNAIGATLVVLATWETDRTAVELGGTARDAVGAHFSLSGRLEPSREPGVVGTGRALLLRADGARLEGEAALVERGAGAELLWRPGAVTCFPAPR